MNSKKIVANIKKVFLFLVNPRLILCLFFAWMITNGWSYLFVILGSMLGINWMIVVGTAYLGLLWIPFTPEKIITVVIAIFLLKLLFPNDKNTLALLEKELKAVKNKLKDSQNKKKDENRSI